VTGPQIVQFSNVINAVFSEQEFDNLLLEINRKLDDYVSRARPFPPQAPQVVAAANSQGWVSQLVSAVVMKRGNTGVVKQFLQDNSDLDPAKNAPGGHPCDALHLFGGKPFIGRRTLRKFLKIMVNGTGRNVLLITAERRRVGKTYSKELVNFLSVHLPPAEFVYVDLDRDNDDPGILSQRIGKRMGLDPDKVPKQDKQQAPRWNQELVEWLIPAAISPERKVWWILLDGFREKLPSEGLQNFISQLAEHVQSTQDYKLILLNYSYDLGLAITAFTYRDKVGLLTRGDIVRFLKKVHLTTHGEEPSKEEIRDYLGGVCDRLNQYKQEHPEMADDQLLVNMAVTDTVESM
jgi:hypothetical protein